MHFGKITEVLLKAWLYWKLLLWSFRSQLSAQWQDPIFPRMSYFSSRASEQATSIRSFILCHSQRERQLLSVPIRPIWARPSHLWDANMKRIPERSDVYCRSAFKSIIRVSIGLAFNGEKKNAISFSATQTQLWKMTLLPFSQFQFPPPQFPIVVMHLIVYWKSITKSQLLWRITNVECCA